MPVITDRNQTLDVLARLEEAKVVMPVFCYDSVMNLEANLHAVGEFAQEYGIKDPVLAPSVTFAYEDMQQADRVLRWGTKEEGLKVCLAALDILQTAEKEGDFYQQRGFRETLEQLVELYEAWGKPDESAKYRNRLKENDIGPSFPEMADTKERLSGLKSIE